MLEARGRPALHLRRSFRFQDSFLLEPRPQGPANLLRRRHPVPLPDLLKPRRVRRVEPEGIDDLLGLLGSGHAQVLHVLLKCQQNTGGQVGGCLASNLSPRPCPFARAARGALSARCPRGASASVPDSAVIFLAENREATFSYCASLRRFLARARYGSSNGANRLAIVTRRAFATRFTTSSVGD